MDPEELLHGLIKNVDLSNTSTTKFDPLRRQLASWLSLPESEIYIVSAGTRASNIPIRMVQGKAKDRHHRLGVAVIGTDQVDLARKHARDQAQLGYDAVAVVAKDGTGKYALESFVVRTEDPLAEALETLFPTAQKFQVAIPTPERARAPRIDIARPPGFVALPIDSLTVEALRSQCQRRNLELPHALLVSCITALRADKHLLITGPPGTGKTSLAEAIAAAAAEACVCAGYVMTTATSDWTSVDTVGAYRQTRAGDLQFHPGLIVEALEADKWAIIDEFNRADIDKAIGQLFSLLSGKAVVLPHEVETDEGYVRVALVPEKEALDPDRHNIEVGGAWRLIATMNDTDLDLLYEVSQALKRRFALIEMNPLESSQLKKLLYGFPSSNREVDLLVQELSGDARLLLGAALWIDLANYLREQITVLAEEHLEVDVFREVSSAAQVFFVPQGISAEIVKQAVQEAHERLQSNANDAIS